MNKFYPYSGKVLVSVFVLLILFTGCVSQKKIRYLQQPSKQDSILLWQLNKSAGYKVQPNDNLYVNIKSLSDKANEIFNTQGNGSGMTGDPSIYLNSYTVSPEGYIDFPLIGKLYVRDLTIDEIKVNVQKMVDDYLKDAIVIVKLVNFNISFLGEFQHPGEFKVYQDKITIFEGIAMAGDLTDFANRKHVTLIRTTEKGAEIHYLNLNSASILSSPYYYLKPNDVIYAAPLPVKQWGGSTFPYGTVFAAISTVILIITLFKTL